MKEWFQVVKVIPSINEKRLSPHLQDLIDGANNSVGTLKEQILEIYHQAVKEGFTPHQDLNS